MPKKRRKQKADPGLPLSLETPAAEFSTVAWMLATMATLGCLVGHVILGWFAKPIERDVLTLFANFLLFAALVCGILSLLLAVVVYRLRKESPPWPVTAGAVAIALVPLAMLLART